MRRGRPWQASAARRLDTLHNIGETAATAGMSPRWRQRRIGCFEGPHPCPSVSTFQKGMTAARQKQSAWPSGSAIAARNPVCCAQGQGTRGPAGVFTPCRMHVPQAGMPAARQPRRCSALHSRAVGNGDPPAQTRSPRYGCLADGCKPIPGSKRARPATARNHCARDALRCCGFRPEPQRATSANASRAAASVASITAASCALDMKPASYADGARYTPRCSIAWKKRLKLVVSQAVACA